MKTFLYLIFTAFIATGAMFGGLNQHEPLLGYAIGFVVWALFLRHLSRKNKHRKPF